jgi:hypothetical protein
MAAAILVSTVMSARYVATAMGVAALVSAAGSAARVAESRCETAGRTVRANDVARVFTTRRDGLRTYHACSRDTGRVVSLIRLRVGYEYLEHPRLTGRYFAGEYWHISFHNSVIIVWGLRQGREIWSGATHERTFADDLEVTRRGAVAWLDDSQVVTKCDRKGRAEIGEADSMLRRIGRTVFWREAGERRSYLLRGRSRGCPG